ncbi:hypothetical protein ACJRO7_016698 [Eucalyptus globulus]|uniref:Integrase catalytic domain-containing protein n=1 Tax=Eucalyptus globulus TaxID=34317 RepID=A0ABD3L7U7_EUCGL
MVKEFIEKHIIHRFGIPELITANQGPVFTSDEVLDFTKSIGIKMVHSMPSSNKVIINLIKKHLEDNPKEWDSLLSSVLWAYRTSKRSITGVSLYMLTLQRELAKEEYDEHMYSNIDELGESRAIALEKLVLQKNRVAKAYKKHVKEKIFDICDIVWKTILPTSMDNEKFGKWSPTWEGSYVITKNFDRNAYHLMEVNGKELPRIINGKFLKRYYSII